MSLLLFVFKWSLICNIPSSAGVYNLKLIFLESKCSFTDVLLNLFFFNRTQSLKLSFGFKDKICYNYGLMIFINQQRAARQIPTTL